MDADKYQGLAERTLIDGPDFPMTNDDIMIVWNALGLAGEAGEVADHVKKGVFHQHGIDREKIAEEIGDVLWYIAALCTKLELSLGDIMERNIEKLLKRYPNGYSAEDSRNRRR